MAEPFIGEIRLFAWNNVPTGWALCDGRLLTIHQNQALFSILGTMYGGNGQTTFALPDLRGRVPIHPDGSQVRIGQSGGEETHTLTVGEMPAHNHYVLTTSSLADQRNPEGLFWAKTSDAVHIYNNTPDADMSSEALSASGGNQAHTNMQPYAVLNFCIALQGYFPPRN